MINHEESVGLPQYIHNNEDANDDAGALRYTCVNGLHTVHAVVRTLVGVVA